MKNKKFYSCEDLQSSIYFGPNSLRHCCQRFLLTEKWKAMLKILKVKSNKDISVEK